MMHSDHDQLFPTNTILLAMKPNEYRTLLNPRKMWQLSCNIVIKKDSSKGRFG